MKLNSINNEEYFEVLDFNSLMAKVNTINKFF